MNTIFSSSSDEEEDKILAIVTDVVASEAETDMRERRKRIPNIKRG